MAAEQGCWLWQPEWVFWLFVFVSNGNGPTSSSCSTGRSRARCAGGIDIPPAEWAPELKPGTTRSGGLNSRMRQSASASGAGTTLSSPSQYSVGRGPLTFGYVTSTGYAPVGRVVTISVSPRHGRVGPCDSPYCGSGGHGLAVKTKFLFNPSSPNKDECCGWGWLPRTQEAP